MGSFEFRPTLLPKRITDFIGEVSMIGNVYEKVSKLDEYANRLVEEMKKIHPFKNDLPLTMLLLNDAIFSLHEESIKCGASNVEPVLEEFIPLKKNIDDDHSSPIKREKDHADKKSWMSSVQLWNPDLCDPKLISKSETKENKEGSNYAKEASLGASSVRPFIAGFMEEVPGFALLTPTIKSTMENLGSRNGSLTVQQQTSRKQRRSWSAELHRRFLYSLQQLGGSHAATPKQIKELMQVDGLTNDEVKSHLQKHRLNTQRLPTITTACATDSVVILGDLRTLQQNRCGNSAKRSSSQSRSPEGPLQLCMNTMDVMGDDYEEAKSESYRWRTHIDKYGKVDV